MFKFDTKNECKYSEKRALWASYHFSASQLKSTLQYLLWSNEQNPISTSQRHDPRLCLSRVAEGTVRRRGFSAGREEDTPSALPQCPYRPTWRPPFCGPLNLDTTHSWRETTAQLPTCQELQARYWPRQTSQPLCHPVGSDYAFSNKAWTTVLGKVSSFQVCHSLETLSALQYYSSEFFCIFMVTVYYSLVLL